MSSFCKLFHVFHHLNLIMRLGAVRTCKMKVKIEKFYVLHSPILTSLSVFRVCS